MQGHGDAPPYVRELSAEFVEASQVVKQSRRKLVHRPPIELGGVLNQVL